MDKTTRSNNASLGDIFGVFAKIGSFTIGGGYAMVPLIQNEVIKRNWISEEEFPDILALAQSAPGLLAVNISIFAGYRIKGIPGAVIATLGSCLPPFVFILLIAMFFSGFRDNPTVNSIFQGIRPAVVALIAVPMIKMAKASNHNILTWAISIASMVLVAFLKVSPIYILLVTIVFSVAVSIIRERRRK